jgi:hypothetical protein
VAGYPTYEKCQKDLAKKDEFYRRLGFLNEHRHGVRSCFLHIASR